MIPLALSCAAALSIAGLPADAPTADPAPPAAVTPDRAVERPAPRPSRMLYRGGAVPPGYVLVPEYNTQLLLGGMSSLIFGYTGATLFALIAGFQSLVQLQRGDPLFALLPVVGPFLALGGPGYRTRVNPDLLYVRDFICLADGAVQLLGVALASVGYFFPTRVLQLQDDGGGGAGWVLPLGPAGTPGLRWSATFGP